MKSVMVVHDTAPTVLPTGNDEDVLVSVWERLHQPKTKNKKILRTRLQYDINVETGGGIYFQFPPSGRCILLFMAGRGVFFFQGGTGRFFFPRRDGAFFFFFRRDGTGRCFFFFFEGQDGTVVFGGGIFFGGTGQNRYPVPPKAI